MPNSSRRRDRETSNEDDEEARIEYGIRRSTRATSFEYRDSSSLSPACIGGENNIKKGWDEHV